MDDPGTKPPATFHGWSRLPDELKVEILAHNLDQKDGINSAAHTRVFAEQLTSVIGTWNREFTTLALETYYTRNVFKVTIYKGMDRKCTNVQHPPVAYGHLIRKMELLAYSCYWCMLFPRRLLTRFSAMRYILNLKLPPVGDVALDLFALLPHDGILMSTLWQASFMHLQSLELKFEYPRFKAVAGLTSDGECAHCQLTTGQVEKVLTAVEEMYIPLQAAKTTVVFTSTCHCFTRLAHVLARMATKSDK